MWSKIRDSAASVLLQLARILESRLGRARGRAVGLILWLLSVTLFAHKDDFPGETFVFVTLDARELELEYWLDAQDEPRGLLHTLGVEYGLMNLMPTCRCGGFSDPGGRTRVSSFVCPPERPSSWRTP